MRRHRLSGLLRRELREAVHVEARAVHALARALLVHAEQLVDLRQRSDTSGGGILNIHLRYNAHSRTGG